VPTFAVQRHTRQDTLPDARCLERLGCASNAMETSLDAALAAAVDGVVAGGSYESFPAFVEAAV